MDHQVTVIIVGHVFKHCIMTALEVNALRLKKTQANKKKNNFTDLRTCAGHRKIMKKTSKYMVQFKVIEMPRLQ